MNAVFIFLCFHLRVLLLVISGAIRFKYTRQYFHRDEFYLVVTIYLTPSTVPIFIVIENSGASGFGRAPSACD